MKRIIVLLMSATLAFVLTACGAKAEPQTPSEVQIINPWQTFGDRKSAEEQAGFALAMPETVADTYKTVSYSVLNDDKPILQVEYQDGDYTVEIRKSRSVGQDISGVYGLENAETLERNGVTIRIYRPSDDSETPNAVLTLIDYNGFAWSIYAPNGYWGDSGEDFLNAIFSQ